MHKGEQSPVSEAREAAGRVWERLGPVTEDERQKLGRRREWFVADTTQRVMDAIAERDADIRPFCDITIKVQDGKPVMVEITSKHKPTV